jgi:hypothetical protein
MDCYKRFHNKKIIPPLKPVVRSTFLLALLDVLILASGFILVSVFDIRLEYNEILLVTAIFTLITILILIIFFRGRNKELGSQTMHTMVAITIKFLAELIFAFLWFFIGKKTGITSVVLFFVLYLTFTLFSVLVILKTLKSKSLE